MIPYLILAAYVLFCWLLYYRGFLSRAGFLVACLVPAWALLAFRGSSVGEDTAMYIRMAEIARDLPWSALVPVWGSQIWNLDQWGFGSTVDNGYLILCKLIMGVAEEPQLVLAFIAAVTMLCFGVFLYQAEEDVAQSLWVFLCGGLYMFAFNGMRQMLAMGIALLCYKPLREGHWLRSVALVLLAALLHKSVLAMLGVILLYRLLDLRWTLPVSLVISCLLPMLVGLSEPIVRLLSAQYASYFSNNYWSASFGGVILFWFVIAANVVIQAKNARVNSCEGRLLAVCGAGYLGLEIAALRVVILERVALYLMPFICLLFPSGVRCLSKRNQWWFRLLTNLILFGMYLSYAKSPVRAYVLALV